MSRESATERGIWQRLSQIVSATAPALGTLIGGPAGGAIGGMVAAALGVQNNPSTIEKALLTDPDAAVKLATLEANLEGIRVRAAADVAIAVEETHQAALDQADLITKRTRPMIARQSWGIGITYAVSTILGGVADPFMQTDLSTLAFDPVIFGTLAGPALWYMGMRGIEKFKHGNSL